MNKGNARKFGIVFALAASLLIASCESAPIIIHSNESHSSESSASSSSEESSSSSRALLENAITMEPQYFVGCCTGLSDEQKSSVTALGGSVLFSYFFDVECERPAAIEELEGDGSYYVVASTTGDATYGPAKAKANIRAKHNTSGGASSKASVIGLRACSVCGELPLDATDVMTNEDIDLTASLYGAEIETSSPAECSVKNRTTGIGYCFARDGQPSDSFLLRLPRVEYARFVSVSFQFEVNSGWFNIGLSSEKNTNIQGDHSHGSLTVRRQVNGVYGVEMVLLKDGDYIGTPVTYRATIEDQAVIEGAVGFPLYATNANNEERYVTLTSIGLKQTCEHSFGYRASGVIGQSYPSSCLYCGEPAQGGEPRLSRSEDVDYSVSTFGAALFRIKGGTYPEGDEYEVNHAITGEADTLTYRPDGDYVSFRAIMPKVNYALYSSVSFPLSVGSAHYGMSLTGGIWNEYTGIHGNNLSVTLSIENKGTNSLDVSLTWGSETIETTIEDATIYNGAAGVPVYFSVANPAAFVVGRPTLTE